jgi:hypothetical protein
MMLDRKEKLALREALELVPLIRKALKKFLGETSSTTLNLTTEGPEMANYQLNALDSVVVTVTDTDDVTGLAVTPDAGSVTAVLSSASDTIALDPTGTFATITAGSVLGTGNTVTVNATYGGVASTPVVGTYDVVADVTPTDATSLSVAFGTETAPIGPAAASAPTHVFNTTTGNFEPVAA